MDNYVNYSNIDGAYFGPVKLEKNPDCLACSNKRAIIEAESTTLLEKLMEMIKDKYQLQSPTVQSSESILYMMNIPGMEETSKENLTKSLSQLKLVDGDELVIGDPSLREAITLKVKFV